MDGKLGIVALVLVGGCIDPSYGPAPFLCAQGGVCPEGYVCVEGVCRSGWPDARLDLPTGDAHRSEAAPDAPGDMTRDAAADAPGDGAPDSAPRDIGPDHPPPPGNWVLVKADTFAMGSPASESCRESDEQQHQVTLTHDFWIQTTQTTRKVFDTVMGYLPAGTPTGCDSCPVALITWHEAAHYCNKLSERSGLASCYYCTGGSASVTCTVAAGYTGKKIYACPGFRLPTEAEWEFACRATTTKSLYSGNLVTCDAAAPLADQIAWYSENSGDAAHPVGQKTPNKWGLYDMSGNVWEWCHDRYAADLGSGAVTDPVVFNASTDVVRRGGSFGSWPRYLRSANRSFGNIGTRGKWTGVRCVRSAP